MDRTNHRFMDVISEIKLLSMYLGHDIGSFPLPKELEAEIEQELLRTLSTLEGLDMRVLDVLRKIIAGEGNFIEDGRGHREGSQG